MIRLPLLIGAKPFLLVNKKGPVIPLGSGNWYISSNHKDSQILIDCSRAGVPVSHPLNGVPLLVEGNCTVQVILGKVGTESSLDIYAECR